MRKNYMTTGTFTRGKKPKGDLEGKTSTPHPEEEVVMSIYNGPVPHESHPKLKLMSRVISAIILATLGYLHWSEPLITFN
jgi:hypothetical protein